MRLGMLGTFGILMACEGITETRSVDSRPLPPLTEDARQADTREVDAPVDGAEGNLNLCASRTFPYGNVREAYAVPASDFYTGPWSLIECDSSFHPVPALADDLGCTWRFAQVGVTRLTEVLTEDFGIKHICQFTIRILP